MKINDKVICLVDMEKNFPAQYKIFHDFYPEKGKVYVIRGIVPSEVPNCPICGVYLTGIYSKNNLNGKEQAWSSMDFQLLDDYRKNKQKFGGEYDWLNKNE